MEYERHFEVVDGAETNVVYHAGPNKCIPSAVGNHDYEKMLDEVGAGTSTIVDVDDTHVPTTPNSAPQLTAPSRTSSICSIGTEKTAPPYGVITSPR